MIVSEQALDVCVNIQAHRISHQALTKTQERVCVFHFVFLFRRAQIVSHTRSRRRRQNKYTFMERTYTCMLVHVDAAL